MLVIIRKNNIAFVGLIFLLLVTVYSLNINADVGTEPVLKQQDTKTVIIDAGHGGEDPGVVSSYSSNKEKDITLKIALKLRELLEDDNYRVILTRSEDMLDYTPGTTRIYEKRKQDLLKRKKIMDEAGADIVVSIHLNGFGQTQYHGAQVFYPPNSDESKKLAVKLQKSLKDMVDPQNKRSALVKKEKIIILKDLKTTTALVECGFLSNREEDRKLGEKEYQAKLAGAIKHGIDKYFE